MVSKTLLDGMSTELEAERVALLHQLAELGVSGDGALSFDEGFADSGQVAAEQGETRSLAASLQERLKDVENALTKLGDGTYGQCEECGEDIATPRLEAMPATRYCIKHA